MTYAFVFSGYLFFRPFGGTSFAFDRGNKLARRAGEPRLPQKIRPGAQRRCGDFFTANPQGPGLDGLTRRSEICCEKAIGFKARRRERNFSKSSRQYDRPS